MEHTQIVNASELETYSDTIDSEAVIPELVWMLVKECPDISTCRIPYGSAINQPGLDGLVETENGFRQFIPKKKSFWEIGTSANPQDKATSDFTKRTNALSSQDRQESAYVFVTPRGAGSGGWDEPAQRKWLDRRKDSGWRHIKILDAVQLADWLREFPAIGKWLAKKMGISKSAAGFSTPAEHWENLQRLTQTGDPPLPVKIFIAGRDAALTEVGRIFRGELKQLVLIVESEFDGEDFVAACIASLDGDTQRSFTNKCLFVRDAETWFSMATLKACHILVASPKLDFEGSGEQLHIMAIKNGHAVIIPVTGAWASGSTSLIPLRSPSATVIEKVLTENGYKSERALELASAGALSLARLKRHLRGLGELPPYTSWQSARPLAQAGLAGRWDGENAADRAAMETLLGKPYGEWIESVRPETLRQDTPLTQTNEKWKTISRGEAWTALGPRLTNEDLVRFHKTALMVLGERDPKLALPTDERFTANLHGKVLKHSPALRSGIAETLALLGSNPSALSSCTHRKPENTAIVAVRELLASSDWITWASLDSQLPLLAEAAPDEFLDAIETALENLVQSPFNEVFAQEGSGFLGNNYITGLLWALETLAWHPDYLVRVTMVLGDLAAIDPGGNWANRPANSLADIFLPWHPQTCAAVPKRKSALQALLQDQPAVGWKVLLTLLPSAHSMTTGSRKPAWRNFIPNDWPENVSNKEYWEQVEGYAGLAVGAAASDMSKLAELLDRFPDIPSAAQARVLEHLSSKTLVDLPETQRRPIWEAMVDLAAKHRKYYNAQWAMPAEAVARVEDAASKLAPQSLILIHHRLFSERDIDLFEEKGDYEKQQTKLNTRRQEAVRQILNTNQLPGVLEFASQVVSPEQVGHALGSIESASVDAVLLPSSLGSTEKAEAAFISGFVWGRIWTKSWPWVDATITSTWSVEQKAKFLAMLPFGRETLTRVDSLLGNEEVAYWKIANANPWGQWDHLLYAVEKLLQYDRPQAAILCLNRLVHEKAAFPINLAERALLDSVASDSGRFDLQETVDLIKWVQDTPSANKDMLFHIEWAYLAILDGHMSGSPKTLDRRMADDPAFFCEIIGIVFWSDKVERIDREVPEARKQIAQNAYRLLRGWKTVPGSTIDGSFDGSTFSKWLAEVKRLTTESGHLRVSMSQIGEVLPYTPADLDGLWINRSVADALNSKDASELRSGFTRELFNMRGVHGFSAGKEERAIAASYHTKADILDQHCYPRFATAIREFAKRYEQDAESEAMRNPYED